jgi:AraC family transcriptional regulator of adaptative response / DNA-3-methyladenine glycosylase II
MRLIADGIVDREGVAGLSRRLGYSTRHLNRLLTDELGAGPLALARAQRAQTARILIETTDLSMTDIAFAAGFGSVRQFNDTIREVFITAPLDLRRTSHRGGVATEPGTVSVRLPTRQPFDAAQILNFLGVRAIPGVETWDGTEYRRAMELPNGHGVASIRLDDPHVRASFRLEDWRDLAPAVGRVRRLLDLDADPVAIDECLAADSGLAPLVQSRPGLRSAGALHPTETLIRAIVGQQVSVAGARTVTGRITADVAEPLSFSDPQLTHVFPSMDRLARVAVGSLPMPTARAATIQRVARLITNGDLELDAGSDRDDLVTRLTAVKGIGPWTANYVIMRGLGDPDVFLETDLGVRHALLATGLKASDAAGWRPWRTYAMHHLWANL